MKVSVVTVCFNCVDTVEDTLKSVLSQGHKDVEYIVVDGGSTDGTQDVVGKYNGCILKFVSEPDDGIYDAMNKGIRMATGDMVGFLNADDMYADERVVSDVAAAARSGEYDGVYAERCGAPGIYVRYAGGCHEYSGADEYCRA